jgi:6-phosphogluconolactonase
MRGNIHVFNTPEELADQFAGELMKWIEDSADNSFHLAISGGHTPNLLFSVLASKFAGSPFWKKTQIWWVDERMVGPDDPESNFGVANRLLFSLISIPPGNIHRINGKNDPDTEAGNYSKQIQAKLKQQHGWPVFDLILLGMGDDGHTASIFPDQLQLLDSTQVCDVAVHPQSGQKRITLTGHVLNNASRVCFLVTGKAKASRVKEIFSKNEEAGKLPAFHIAPENGLAEWYLDKEAVSLLGVEN